MGIAQAGAEVFEENWFKIPREGAMCKQAGDNVADGASSALVEFPILILGQSFGFFGHNFDAWQW